MRAGALPPVTGSAGLAAVLDRCGGGGTLALAVSGGGDSMALLALAAGMAGRRLIALTFDHGLRAAAAEEARMVAARCAALGIAHHVLHADSDLSGPGLMARARQARMAALTAACHRLVAPVLLTGHTRDDVAETVLMRVRRGPSDRGASGIAAVSKRDGVRIVRPLTGTTRQALRGVLQAAGWSWVEDPTNADTRFERTRARAMVHALPPGHDPARLAVASSGFDACVDALVTAYARDGMRCDRSGVVALDLPALAALPPVAGRSVLRMALVLAGGRAPYGPAPAALEGLRVRLSGTEPVAASLAACTIRTNDARVILAREARNLPVLDLAPGQTGVWDGRWLVSLCGRAPAPVRVRAALPQRGARAFRAITPAVGADDGEYSAVTPEGPWTVSLWPSTLYGRVPGPSEAVALALSVG